MAKGNHGLAGISSISFWQLQLQYSKMLFCFGLFTIKCFLSVFESKARVESSFRVFRLQ